MNGPCRVQKRRPRFTGKKRKKRRPVSSKKGRKVNVEKKASSRTKSKPEEIKKTQHQGGRTYYKKTPNGRRLRMIDKKTRERVQGNKNARKVTSQGKKRPNEDGKMS